MEQRMLSWVWVHSFVEFIKFHKKDILCKWCSVFCKLELWWRIDDEICSGWNASLDENGYYDSQNLSRLHKIYRFTCNGCYKGMQLLWQSWFYKSMSRRSLCDAEWTSSSFLYKQGYPVPTRKVVDCHILFWQLSITCMFVRIWKCQQKRIECYS
jgi:hypothetical protein